MAKQRKTEIKGFAAFDGRGHILWDTLRATKEETKKQLEKYNPDVPAGYFPITPIYIGTDINFQYDLENHIEENA